MKVAPLSVNLRAVVVRKVVEQQRVKGVLGLPKTKPAYLLQVIFIGSYVHTKVSVSKEVYDATPLRTLLSFDVNLHLTKMYRAVSTAPAPSNDLLASARRTDLPPSTLKRLPAEEPGVTASAELRKMQPCLACGATGVHPSGTGVCDRCHGAKEVVVAAVPEQQENTNG